MWHLVVLSLFASWSQAQDPTGTVQGQVVDPSMAVVPNAAISAMNQDTGFTIRQTTASDGTFRLAVVPIGLYSVQIRASGFSELVTRSVRVDVNRVVTLPLQLTLAQTGQTLAVEATGSTIDSSPAIGNVVLGQEARDLPLNGRNVFQLGLLQPGVAPVTAGVLQAGGIKRQNQAFAVNGQPPEANSYFLDGVTNVDNVNGGFALRTPPDAIAEFRILTSNAPAEYGRTSGGTTAVLTRSGGNSFHGSLYEFLRNDILDARNFFAAATEPLKQNQFGGTVGGPLRKNRDFFFTYYEAQRTRQGETRTAIVPTAAQRNGDFSGLGAPLINVLSGQRFRDEFGRPDRLPTALLNPISLRAQQQLMPLGNLSPTLYSSTQVLSNQFDQGGFRLDHYFVNGDRLFARYAKSAQSLIDPLPINGSNVPGFPTANGIDVDSATLSSVHVFSPRSVQTTRVAFFRDNARINEAQNHTPGTDLGFRYQPTLGINAGTPFLNIAGYAKVGNPITGPQQTVQNDYQAYYSLALTAGAHNWKFGADLDRQQINALLGIATNGFFVFAPFPATNAYASFLLGQPAVFFQGGGDFSRGLRKWANAAYVQDDWRVTPRLTLSLGLRYEVNTPYSEIRNRLNAWAPGRKSKVRPDAPANLLFPGDAGIPSRIAAVNWKQWMPRVGFSWDPGGRGDTVLRGSYGMFYDGFTNGVGGPLQAAASALPWTEAFQLPGPGVNIADPYRGTVPPFVNRSFVRPATVLTVESGLVPPYSQQWSFSIQRSMAHTYLADVRYVGNKGTHLPRFIEANPAIFGPGATASNADARRPYANCSVALGSCAFASVGLIAGNNSSTYHALQATLSRQFTNGLTFLASYWWSKSLDYVSSLNLAGSAPTLVAGENDLAQNPADLRAEHGPSLFDARHRFVFSGSYALPSVHHGSAVRRVFLNDWQLNTIATLSTGSPFTVYDSNNASLQGQSPEITGFYSSRPDVVSDPNAGLHTPDRWVQSTAFQSLTQTANAGQFGNLGRNAIRGPGYANVDVSMFKSFALAEELKLQFRTECFNLLNHANFALPQNDLNSPGFGQILQAGQPRLLQFAMKVVF